MKTRLVIVACFGANYKIIIKDAADAHQSVYPDKTVLFSYNPEPTSVQNNVKANLFLSLRHSGAGRKPGEIMDKESSYEGTSNCSL